MFQGLLCSRQLKFLIFAVYLTFKLFYVSSHVLNMAELDIGEHCSVGDCKQLGMSHENGLT